MSSAKRVGRRVGKLVARLAFELDHGLREEVDGVIDRLAVRAGAGLVEFDALAGRELRAAVDGAEKRWRGVLAAILEPLAKRQRGSGR
jgi:hypothetical protein